MQHFDKRGCTVGALIDAREELGREKDKEGPHLLALALDNETGNGVEQRDAAFHRIPEKGLEGFHVLINRRFYVLQIHISCKMFAQAKPTAILYKTQQELLYKVFTFYFY